MYTLSWAIKLLTTFIALCKTIIERQFNTITIISYISKTKDNNDLISTQDTTHKNLTVKVKITITMKTFNEKITLR